MIAPKIMSILGIFLGRTTILNYEILFDDKDKVSVQVEPKTTPIKQEYIKLFGSYLAKIIYNFGGSNRQPSVMVLGTLTKIIKFGISPKTDCFKIAELDDVIQYSSKIDSVVTKYSGTLFGWRNGNQSIKTNFSSNPTEQQTVFGALALMQFAINENVDSENNLQILQKMTQGMMDMYEVGLGGSMRDIIGIPTAAFNEARTEG